MGPDEFIVLGEHDLGFGLAAQLVIPSPPGGVAAAAQNMHDDELEVVFTHVQCRIVKRPTAEVSDGA